MVSTGDEVELFLNGRSLGKGKQSYRYLFTFDNVPFESGTLEAVASDGSRYRLETAGEPHHLQLTAIANPNGTQADGADMILFQVEVLDKEGRRCPLDDRMIHFDLSGEAQWIGGIATRNNLALQRPDENRPAGLLDAAVTKNVSDNYVGLTSLPVECGVNRVLVRTTTKAGKIRLKARAQGLKPAHITLRSSRVDTRTSSTLPPSSFSRGETPLTPSYIDQLRTIPIISATAGCDTAHANRSYDDNELSEWKNDGRPETAWITYTLKEAAEINQIDIKLTGWRQRSYPLEIYADDQLVWKGMTPKTLGYVHLTLDNPVCAQRYTIRQTGAADNKDGFGGIVEVAATTAGELDLYRTPGSEKVNSELRIVEIDFLQKVQKK